MTQEQTTGPDPEPKVLGLVAEFASPDALIAAIERVRSDGYTKIDAFTPFPVHGLDEALAIRPTRLPWLVLAAGLSGGIIALAGQWWTNAIDYPMIISGKPLFSLPANIPVIFEVIILFSAFAAFLGMLALNGLPRHANPLFDSARFLRATTDRFFLLVDAADSRFDPAGTRSLLESLGSPAVEVCRQTAAGQRLPRVTYAIMLVCGCLALIPPALIARARVTTSDKPRWHTFTDMDFTPGFKPQTPASSSLFANRQSARLPVPGTIARGQLYADERLYRGIEPDAPAEASADTDGATSGQTSATGTSAEPVSEESEPPAETPTETPAEPPTETPAEKSPAEKSPAEKSPAEKSPAVADPPAAATDEEPQPAWVTTIPWPVTIEQMRRGRLRYNVYCAPCHGRVGDGDGIVSRTALALEQGTWVPPLSLHAASVIEQPVGQLYHSITHGVRKMPAYGDQIAVPDRWAIVLYIRALQRSRNAALADVPANVIDSLRDL